MGSRLFLWLRRSKRKIVAYYTVTKRRLKIKNSKNKIKKLKNSYKGKRCFIVGNGPSLKMADLELLKNEITFGSHRIYKAFEKTDWRPTYYCAQDLKLIEASYDEINKADLKKRIIAFCDDKEIDLIKKAVFIPLLLEPFSENGPKFSKNPELGLYEGMTVTYMILQLVAYMGFSEIYLIGVDHSYSIEKGINGEVKHKGESINHFYSDDTMENIPQPELTNISYTKALSFFNSNGIKIFNATRGGNLEVFERVSFERIIKRN